MFLNRTHHGLSPRWNQPAACLGIVWLAALLIGTMPTTSHAQLTPLTQGQITPQILLGGAMGEMSPQLENDIRQALISYQSGDIAGTLTWLKRAKEREASFPPVELLIAKLHYAANKPAIGRATLERVALVHPDDPEAYLIFADRALVAGRVTDAELLYMKSVNLIKAFDNNPKRKRYFMLRTRAGLAGIAQQRAQWSTAVTHLKAWVKDDPKNAVAQTQLGTALFMASRGTDSSQVREAYKTLEEARKIDPSRPNPDLLVGQLYSQLGNRAEAEKFMSRAIQSDGKTLSTVVTVAQWWLEGDRLDKAEPLLVKALEMNPKARDVVLLNGVAARMRKDYTTAQEYLIAAHLTSPSDFTAMNQLALVLIDEVIATKDPKGLRRAHEFAVANARQYPNDVNANSTLGWILYHMGRQSEAERAFTNAMKQPNSLSPDSRYFMAKIMFDRGQNDVAAAHLNAALRAARLFIYRTEAQALLAQISGTSGGESTEQ